MATALRGHVWFVALYMLPAGGMATALRGHVCFVALHMLPAGGMATALRGHVWFVALHMPTQSGGHGTRHATRKIGKPGGCQKHSRGRYVLSSSEMVPALSAPHRRSP